MQDNYLNKLSDKEKILSYLEDKGITKTQFYARTGLSHGFLNSGKSLGVDKLRIIANAFPDLNIEWVIRNTGEMIVSKHKETNISNKSKGVPLIPILASAGIPVSSEYQITEDMIEDRYVIPDFKNVDFYIKMRGDSMYPKYRSGDVLACRKLETETFIQWGRAYLLDTSQDALVKRLFKSDDGGIICRSDNDKYPDFELQRDDIRSISLIIGVARLE